MGAPAGAVVAAGVTAAVLVVLVPLLRDRGVIDVPGARSSHDTPVPRGGGIAFAIGMLAGVAVARPDGWLVVALGAAIAGAVGLADDLRPLGAPIRLAVQVTVAVPVAAWILGSGRPWSTPTGVAAFAAVVVGAVWIVGYVNAFNFMDGINGITAVQLIVTGLAWAGAAALGDTPGLTAVGAVTAAAGVAFLPWNAPDARVFPGDVGSYFAGVWLAAWAVIAVASGMPIVAVAAPLTLTLADTSVTLVTRLAAGEPWHRAHRRHAYQRLVAAGWSHARVSLVFGGLAAAAAAVGMAALAGGAWGVVGAAGAGAVSLFYLTLPGRVRVPMAGGRSRS